jgi:hypothetical protein
LKFFCKLKNDDDQAKAAQELEKAAVVFCANATAATPLTKPVKLAGRAEALGNANPYEVGFVSSLMPPSKPAKPGNPEPCRPTDWPVHMFYAFDTENDKWRAAVNAKSWYAGEAGARTGSLFVARKKNKNGLCFVVRSYRWISANMAS